MSPARSAPELVLNSPRNVSDTTAEEHDVNKHDGRPAPWTFTSQSSSNLYKTDKDLRAGK